MFVFADWFAPVVVGLLAELVAEFEDELPEYRLMVGGLVEDDIFAVLVFVD